MIIGLNCQVSIWMTFPENLCIYSTVEWIFANLISSVSMVIPGIHASGATASGLCQHGHSAGTNRPGNRRRLSRRQCSQLRSQVCKNCRLIGADEMNQLMGISFRKLALAD